MFFLFLAEADFYLRIKVAGVFGIGGEKVQVLGELVDMRLGEHHVGMGHVNSIDGEVSAAPFPLQVARAHHTRIRIFRVFEEHI
jgi:hypothetical protein